MVQLLLALMIPAHAGDALLPGGIAAHGQALAAAQGQAVFLATDDNAAAALQKATRKLEGVSVERVDNVGQAFSVLGQPCALRASWMQGAVHAAVIGTCPRDIGLPPPVAVPAGAVGGDDLADPLATYTAQRLYLGQATRQFHRNERTPAMGADPAVLTITLSKVTYRVVCRGEDKPLDLAAFGVLTGDPDTEGNTFMGGLSRGWASIPAVFTPRPKGFRVTLPAAAFDVEEAESVIEQYNAMLRDRLGLDQQATATVDGQPSFTSHPALEWCNALPG